MEGKAPSLHGGRFSTNVPHGRARHDLPVTRTGKYQTKGRNQSRAWQGMVTGVRTQEAAVVSGRGGWTEGSRRGRRPVGGVRGPSVEREDAGDTACPRRWRPGQSPVPTGSRGGLSERLQHRHGGHPPTGQEESQHSRPGRQVTGTKTDAGSCAPHQALSGGHFCTLLMFKFHCKYLRLLFNSRIRCNVSEGLSCGSKELVPPQPCLCALGILGCLCPAPPWGPASFRSDMTSAPRGVPTQPLFTDLPGHLFRLYPALRESRLPGR